ncbi:MAG: cation diffusion facilitator family transporter [Actinomycetota bacterium]|nr:cation diffusion facilitator family transporter [Actinomycetota bacterium]
MSGAKGHSHDLIDRSALYADDGIRAIKLATAGMIVTALFEFAVVLIGGSRALLADSLHNFGDIFTTVGLWMAFTASRRAANRRYTFGYDRFEDLVGIGIILVIAITTGVSGYESVKALIHPRAISAVTASILAAAVGVVGNELVARYKIKVGTKIGSMALQADGKHSHADAFVSAAAVAGLTGVALGFPRADPIAGLLITLVIANILVRTSRDVLERIVDKIDPMVIASIESAALEVPDVTSLHEVRARWAGRSLFVQLHVEVDGRITVDAAHAIAERVESAVIHEVDGVASVLVHVDPSGVHEHSPHEHSPHEKDSHEHGPVSTAE